MMPSPQARKSARALVSWPPNLNFATLKSFFVFHQNFELFSLCQDTKGQETGEQCRESNCSIYSKFRPIAVNSGAGTGGGKTGSTARLN